VVDALFTAWAASLVTAEIICVVDGVAVLGGVVALAVAAAFEVADALAATGI